MSPLPCPDDFADEPERPRANYPPAHKLADTLAGQLVGIRRQVLGLFILQAALIGLLVAHIYLEGPP